MRFYKDTLGKIHALEDAAFFFLLPEGCVEITEKEVAELQTVNNPLTEEIRGILAELAALDMKKIRPLSEGDASYLAKLNTQSTDLRAKLKALQS